MSEELFDGKTPTWCPGCGDFPIRLALKRAFVAMNLAPSDVFIVFGVGCSGNMNDFMNAYAIHSLHGRALPNAIGVKLVRPGTPVVAIVGDGDCYGEGGNHFLHASRGNHDITVIIHDNRVYGLTTGQVAPTSMKGAKSKSTPEGIIEVPINPLTLAMTQGATYVAQAFSGDVGGAIEIVKQAVEHKGFSVVNILQPCVTFNKVNTYQYYLKNAYKLAAEYDPADYPQALMRATELNSEKFPLGVIYKVERPAYHEQVSELAGRKSLLEGDKFSNFEALIKEFV